MLVTLDQWGDGKSPRTRHTSGLETAITRARSWSGRIEPGRIRGGSSMVGQAKVVDKLRELARNLWWTWQPNVISLFRELDPALWRATDHNPIEFLKKIPPEKLERLAAEVALHSRIDYAFRTPLGIPQEYRLLGESPRLEPPDPARSPYFSAEFGLHESLPIYSGGLGVLAGDHLKSVSDLGVPLIGIGLLYAEGLLPPDARRRRLAGEILPRQQPRDAADRAGQVGPDGQPIRVSIDTNVGVLHAKVWRAEVGRTTLLLLDSKVDENSNRTRRSPPGSTAATPGSGFARSCCSGVGGVRAIQAFGIHPSVLHLNEGHSAFAGLEMIRSLMESEGMPFGEAARIVSQDDRLHHPHPGRRRPRPVPQSALVEEHLGKIREALHLSYDDFMGLGRIYPGDPNEPFCMTVLALKFGRHANGVSALHGQVSRQMWHPLYPNRPEEEVPIGHITNGVHVRSWLAPQMHQLFDRHLGPDWDRKMSEPDTWAGIHHIDDAELWETQQVLKAELINFVRRSAGRAGQAPGRGGGRDQAGLDGARPRQPDDRLRPPVRHLQAGRPGPQGRRADRRPDQRGRTGRSSSSTRARPTPRTSSARS